MARTKEGEIRRNSGLTRMYFRRSERCRGSQRELGHTQPHDGRAMNMPISEQPTGPTFTALDLAMVRQNIAPLLHEPAYSRCADFTRTLDHGCRPASSAAAREEDTKP